MDPCVQHEIFKLVGQGQPEVVQLPPSMKRRAPSTPLNAGGQSQGKRPGSVLSAARRIGDATAARNGRATLTPAIAVPDASAAAVAARRQRALRRLVDPLLDDAGFGGGGGAAGDLLPETTAFDALPESQRLPAHPPLTAMLRAEDATTTARQLPRFGGTRGAHRALPSWKCLAREKLRVASLAQQREVGAVRLHAQLRAHASAFSAMLFSAYQSGVISNDALIADAGKDVYSLLCHVFSLPAVRNHCRVFRARGRRAGRL